MPCYPTELYSLTGSVAAADLSPPPNLKLIAGVNATQNFQVAYELLGVTFTSSLTNFGTTEMGVFVLIGTNTPTTTYGKSTPAVIGAVTGQNSIVGPPALPIPSDKVVAQVFLQPVLIKANTPISLYAFGDNTAGNALNVFASLVMRQKA